ncbi:hypothetical protein H0N99_01685 [Candidatus Micrarchaeota archaeon]|nr:hypothetical protein [Candidatus Micrarchaeota archaeon]
MLDPNTLTDLILALNFLCILFIGLTTSYDDIKKNKIRNKYIAYALLFGIGTNVLLPLITEGSWFLYSDYLRQTLMNALLALFAGFALWYFKIWRAGDGKLFFAYAFLIPLSIYNYGHLAYFQSLTLLVNTLISLFLLLSLNVWITTSTDEKIEILKNSLNPKQLFYILMSLISTQWLLAILVQPLLPTGDILTTGSLAIIFLTLLMNRYQETVYEASIPLVILRILIDYKTMSSYAFMSQLIILFILFVGVVNFITSLGSFRFSERIKIMNLKSSAYCAEKIVRRGEFYEASLAPKEDEQLLDLNYENLTDKDIKKLNLLYKNCKLKCDELTIRQTIPFAPFLFLGVLLTLLIRGDVVAYSRFLLLKYL